MSFGSWPASRIALYSLVWLVGFPFVLSVATLFVQPNFAAVPTDSARRAQIQALEQAMAEARLRNDSASVTRVMELAGIHPGPHPDTLVVRQVGDPTYAVGLEVSGEHELGESLGAHWFGWFVPPALFVGAWAWARRRRPDVD